MNILHISPNFNYSCGVSKHVFDILKYYSHDTNINIKFITAGGDALPKLFDIGIEPYIMNFKKGLINVLFFPSNLFELNKYCIQNDIDIIHTHHRYPELLSVILSKKLKFKTITTAHSFVSSYKQLSFKSDKIVAVSNAVKKEMLQYFNVPTDKIATLYNCIMPSKVIDANKIEKLRKELKLKENDFVILFLGRINNIKGVDILIKAFRKISEEYSNVKLILLGSILDKTLSRMNTNFNENIITLSAQSQVSSYYKISNLVILPSRVEPLGYTMLESGYFKKPFIGSRTGGIAEFIEDGVNGFLFKPGNAEDLADKIRFIINNPEKAKLAAEKLHIKVIKYCNCEEYFAEITNIYNELLNE